MRRSGMVRVEAEFVAYLRAAKLMGNDWKVMHVELNSWKRYREQVVSTGESRVTVKKVVALIRGLGDVPPLPDDTKAIIQRELGADVDLDHPGEKFANDGGEFQKCYQNELRRIRDAQVAARKQGRSGEVTAATTDANSAAQVPAPPPHIWVAFLPPTGPDFVGRQAELQMLTEALYSRHRHAVTVMAMPGSGKSALINEWLRRLAPDYAGVDVVFGWRFTADDPLSSVRFLEHALHCFGDPDPQSGTPAIRAERLVKRIRERRVIIVLDALEAVQDPKTHSLQVEPAMIVIRELATQLDGLLVITSWFDCPDISHLGRHVAVMRIPPLTADDGRQLLERMALKANAEECQALVRRCNGHALSVRVLAGFARCLGGDWPRVLGMGLQEIDQHQESGLSRIMQAYDACLRPLERAVLRTLATFSAGRLPREALAALLQAPAVARLCDAPADGGDVPIRLALSALEELGLVNQTQVKQDGPTVDVHPLVRAHYVLALPEGMRSSGYRCLRDVYRRMTNQKRETDAELECAYAAVASGISAGLYDDAIEDFRTLLNRGREGRTWDAYGAFAANTALLRPLFSQSWEEPLASISQTHRAFLLFEVGWHLRADGRLAECRAPLRAAIDANSRVGDFRAAMLAAIHLALVCLETGELKQARSYVTQSQQLAKRLDDPFWYQATRLVDGFVCLQVGDDGHADECYREVSRDGREVVEDPFNLGIGAHLICDYWLDREIEAPGLFPEPLRALRTNSPAWESLAFWFRRLQHADQGRSLLAKGLLSLTKARLQTLRLLGMPHSAAFGLDDATADDVLTGLAAAIETLERSSLQHFAVPAHITAAELNRVLAHAGRKSKIKLGRTNPADLLNEALAHAKTALDRANRHGAHLFAIGAHLEIARVLLVRGRRAEIGEHVRCAETLINQFGYRPRRHELVSLGSPASRHCGSLSKAAER